MVTAKQFLDGLRSHLVQPQPPEPFDLSPEEFREKVLKEFGEGLGWRLLDLMENGEWRVCERLGLCDADVKTRRISGADWHQLTGHLRIVESV